MKNKYLCYEDFGAKGDGITDDMEAIVACHEEANKTGTPVKTKDGAAYYIGGRPLTAVIMTDVDFGTSTFIIDDRKVERRELYIFRVCSAHQDFTLDIKTLDKNQKKIEIPEGKGKNLYVRVFNENHKMFIRKGLNMNSGFPTGDCFKVDKDGNILSPIVWDYKEITKAYARCIDDTPIVIKGGIFKTIANQEESFYKYFSRGIYIKRSNVTVDGIKYFIEGEGEQGAPYGGFIFLQESTDCTVKNALLTPHLTYFTKSKIPGQKVSMGSYGINTTASIDMKYINMTQTIDISDRRYWGVYTSNYCKNLYLENCTLSRYDAHEGVANITIKGCTFGHQCMNLIGFGDAIIEDTHILCGNFINLRYDYGAFWNGNVTIKNCKWKLEKNNLNVIYGYNVGDHDFGYPCMLPKNIIIDGLYIDDTDIEDCETYILPNYDVNYKPGLPYPYGIPEKLTFKNIVTASGRKINVTPDLSIYEGMEISKL